MNDHMVVYSTDGHGLCVVLRCVYAKLLQVCLTPSYPMDWSLPVSSVHGILQARLLEWVAIPSCTGSF